MDDRRKTIMVMLDYFNNLSGNRLNQQKLGMLADLLLGEMEEYDDDTFTKVMEYLFDNYSRFPSIADIRDAYEEVMKRETLYRPKSDDPNRIMPRKLVLIQEHLINWIIEGYFKPDDPEVKKNIALLKAERTKLIEQYEKSELWFEGEKSWS